MFNRLALVLIVSLIFTASVFAQPFAYVTNSLSDSVSVIDTRSNTAVALIPVGSGPAGIAITPDCIRARMLLITPTILSL